MTISLVPNISSPIVSANSIGYLGSYLGVLSNYGVIAISIIDAAIKALFANGEQGAWYDPSDLTTMFQDRAGTTPVTADGQPVGLILDKSKGLVLGSELVEYPLFGTLGASWTIVGDTIVRDGSTGTAVLASQGVVTLSTTKLHKISFNVSNLTGDSLGIRCGGGAAIGPISSNGDKTFYLSGGGALASAITFLPWGGGAATATISNISVKEIPGNHAVAPSDAARPLKTSTSAADWINYDAVDDVLNSTFPSSLGSSCTVCRANVGAAPTTLTAQTIGTSYADSTDNAGLIIINRALTAQETTDVTAWLLAKGATS